MSLIYSSVTPAKNEAKNLPELIERLDAVFKKLGEPYEIIVVNDNSTDDSKAVLESLRLRFPALKPIHRPAYPGVGNAIKEGLSAAKGNIIVTLDGDLSHDPAEIPALLKGLDTHDFVCGSRYIAGGKADMNFSRIILSGTFNFIFRTLIGLPVKDFSSGFRVYKRTVIEAIRLNGSQFGVYIEIPIKAHLAGFKLTERPITYHQRKFGTTQLNYLKQGPEYIKVALDALGLKLKDLGVRRNPAY
jgi:glycosyltransferase involved in cell wall biosynthesis